MTTETFSIPFTLDVTIRIHTERGGDVMLTPDGFAGVAPRPVLAPLAKGSAVPRPARVRKPSKRPARKAKPAALPVAAEPVKAPTRAKKSNVQAVPANAQAVYDAVQAGASQSREIRERAKVAPLQFRHAMKTLTDGKVPGLRLYMAGDRSKARYGVTQAQADERFKAATSPQPEPRKSQHVPPKKRVRTVRDPAAPAAEE